MLQNKRLDKKTKLLKNTCDFVASNQLDSPVVPIAAILLSKVSIFKIIFYPILCQKLRLKIFRFLPIRGSHILFLLLRCIMLGNSQTSIRISLVPYQSDDIMCYYNFQPCTLLVGVWRSARLPPLFSLSFTFNFLLAIQAFYSSAGKDLHVNRIFLDQSIVTMRSQMSVMINLLE